MVNLAEKVAKIISNEGISVNAMEKLIGASKGVLGKFLNQDAGTDIQSKWLLMIAEKFPQYSAEWLVRDADPMIRVSEQNTVNGINNGHVGSTYGAENQQTKPVSCDACDLLAAKNQIIAAQQGTIEAQRIAIDALRH